MADGGVGVTDHAAHVASVRIRELPVALYAASRERHEGLLRELALVELDAVDADEAVRGLPDFAEDLRSRYGSLMGPVRERVEAAIARGGESLDLDYELPVELADSIDEYARRLDAADELCRRGALLTLEPSEEIVALRRWLLSEVSRQLRGGQPLSWSQWRARR